MIAKRLILILFIAVAATIMLGQQSARAADCPDGSVKVSVAVQGDDKCIGSQDKNPIYDYLAGIIKWLGGAIGLAVVITLIVSGIQYSASSGEPANIAKAKDRIFNAAIGLILYIMLAAVVRYLIPGVFE